MLTDLTIIQDEATRWGSDPYGQMIADAKARQARKDAIAKELQIELSDERRRQNEEDRRKKFLAELEKLAEDRLQRQIRDEHERAIQTIHHRAHITVARIAELFSLSGKDVFSPSRAEPIVTCRQICIYQIHKKFCWSLPQIGRFFKDRDHTTVLHAIRKINRMKKDDGEFAARLAEIDEIVAAI